MKMLYADKSLLLVWKTCSTKFLQSFAIITMFTFVGLIAEAQVFLPNLEAFNGVWLHSGDRQEVQMRRNEIESVTRGLPSFIRAKARKSLDERTTPPQAFKINVEGDRIELIQDENRVSLRLDAEPVMVERNGTRGALSVHFDGERIMMKIEGGKGKRVSIYELSPDRKRLTMSVNMTGERLSSPLNFKTTYVRI